MIGIEEKTKKGGSINIINNSTHVWFKSPPEETILGDDELIPMVKVRMMISPIFIQLKNEEKVYLFFLLKHVFL